MPSTKSSKGLGVQQDRRESSRLLDRETTVLHSHGQIYPIDQLDVEESDMPMYVNCSATCIESFPLSYNMLTCRPDVVFEQPGCTDPSVILGTGGPLLRRYWLRGLQAHLFLGTLEEHETIVRGSWSVSKF